MKECTSIWKLKRLLSNYKIYSQFFLSIFHLLQQIQVKCHVRPECFNAKKVRVYHRYGCVIIKKIVRGEKMSFNRVVSTILLPLISFCCFFFCDLVFVGWKIWFIIYITQRDASQPELFLCFSLWFLPFYIIQKMLPWKKKWKLVTVHNFFWEWQLFLPFLCLMKKVSRVREKLCHVYLRAMRFTCSALPLSPFQSFFSSLSLPP